MRKLLLTSLIALMGCLGTTNRHVQVRRSDLDVEEGVSIVDSQLYWWRTPVYADTEREDNPWEEFIHPAPEDRWFDPWATDPPSNYGVTIPPRPTRRVSLGPAEAPQMDPEPLILIPLEEM